MPITITPVFTGTTTRTWDVIANADADNAATIPHGFGVIPRDIQITPLLPAAYTAVWQLGVVDATNINLVKGTAAGSGNAANQLRVTARIPHSIVS